MLLTNRELRVGRVLLFAIDRTIAFDILLYGTGVRCQLREANAFIGQAFFRLFGKLNIARRLLIPGHYGWGHSWDILLVHVVSDVGIWQSPSHFSRDWTL